MSAAKSWLRGRVLALTLLVAALVGTAVFFPQLRAWFAGGQRSATSSNPVHSHSNGPGARGVKETEPPGARVSAYAFSPEARNALLAALDAYEVIRAGLADDSVAALDRASKLAASALATAAKADASAPAEILERLEQAEAAARSLGAQVDAEAARPLFSTLSNHLVALTSADAALMEGRHLFECPMWDGFNGWIQPSSELANPYMGQAMLTCGSEQPWTASVSGTADHQHDPEDISHYTCSMHPWVKKATDEEACPVCSMDLTPVTKEEVSGGVVRVDGERRQAFGVRTAKVQMRKLTVVVDAVGRIATDERRVTDVSLKVDGFVEKLYVEETGQRVKKGQRLFDIYSPELFAAQHELILAARQSKTALTGTQKERSAALLTGARKRMRLWDLSNRQIDSIIAGGKPLKRIAIRSPASGFVLEKSIVEGAAVKTGIRLYRIANLERVWAEAELYEAQLPLVRLGQRATVRLSNVKRETLAGNVSFIHPTIDPRSRTAKVRIELANDDLSLRPDMFVDVKLDVDVGDKLAVPEAAIIYSGPRRIVFVDIGDDRLRPTVVGVGVKAGGYVEVLSGLREGETVVVSGNFLIAAESRLKSSTGIW